MCKCKKFLKDWNYCKHAKLVGAVYLTLFAIDMTVGYVVAKKVLGSLEEEGLLDEEAEE